MRGFRRSGALSLIGAVALVLCVTFLVTFFFFKAFAVGGLALVQTAPAEGKKIFFWPL